MEPTLGFLLSDVSRLMRRAFDQQAAKIGLSLAQCRALIYLARNEGINQAGLAELLEIQPISLARLLDRMGGNGWIERRADPADRRVHRLYLTDKARPVLEQVRALAAEIRANATVGLAPEQVTVVMTALRTMHSNLVAGSPATAQDSENDQAH
ncbi:MAG: MarR family winged helix-turn-helix transcriptional regulator [Magnetospirillum sp.]